MELGGLLEQLWGGEYEVLAPERHSCSKTRNWIPMTLLQQLDRGREINKTRQPQDQEPLLPERT